MITFVWFLTISTLQIEQIRTFYVSAFLSQNRFKEKQLTDYFDKKIVPRFAKRHPLLLCMDGGRIIAFACYEPWGENTYYLAEMAVSPDYQRRGLGKKLIFSLFDQFPDAQKIVLLTEKANLWAQNFYEAIGFVPSTFQHPDYPEGFIGYELNTSERKL